MFTDRDGKFQLLALAESGFDPLARSCRFMLTEEAHHMFVGQTGVARVIQRTCELMNENPGKDVRELGGIPLDLIQRYVNFWASSSVDLFGAEVSSNASNFFRSGLKGRAWEERYTDHQALEDAYTFERYQDGAFTTEEVPLRNAMNEVLRDEYIKDNEKGVEYWNRVCEKAGVDFRFRLPHRRFNRTIGEYGEARFDVDGNPLDEGVWERDADGWLPSEADRDFVRSLMQPVTEPGRMAGWIAPPAKGIDGKTTDFEYVLP
jgi:benzoyl-CoA 2,3-dioxygenase component B